MHHGFHYEHIVTALCVLIAVFAVWRTDRYRRVLHAQAMASDEELAELLYQLRDVLEEYRKIMERNCCFHQKHCLARGEAKILPQIIHVVRTLGKRALPEGLTLSSESALNALQTELKLYAESKVDVSDVEELLKETVEGDDEPTALEASSASPRPRGRPRKNNPV
jgi:hypothetical protein